MNYRLAQLKQRLKIPDRQEQPPVQQQDNSAFGDALSQLIRDAVQQGIAEQQPKVPAAERLHNIDRQVAESIPPPANDAVPEHLKPFGAKPSTEWPAPTKTTPFPKAPITVSLMRDAAGKAIGATVGDKQFKIERNGEGRAIRMVEVT